MNESLLLWINQGWQSPQLDMLFIWLSAKATFSFPLMLIIIVFLGVRFGRPGWFLGLGMIIVAASGDLFGNLLKSIFAQPRPCLEYWDVIRMPRAESTRCMSSDNGMPSNHALNFFATFSFLAFFVRRHSFTIAVVVLSSLVALSRVYLGEHFPSQIAAGSGIGIVYGLTLALLGKHYFYEKLNIYQEKTKMT